MSTISREQLDTLIAAIHSHDFLRRLVEAIEQSHRLVFHSVEDADWSLVRRSAEQILVAEIHTRHHGDFDGIYHALRAMEAAGKPWSVAISELAGQMHSYFTTPLGIVLRRDLFGDNSVFITPIAYEWIRRRDAARASGAAPQS